MYQQSINERGISEKRHHGSSSESGVSMAWHGSRQQHNNISSESNDMAAINNINGGMEAKAAKMAATSKARV